MTESDETNKIANIAFYKFIDLENPEGLKSLYLPLCEELGIKGTILLASEGLNGMLSGTRAAIDQFVKTFKADSRFSDILIKWSYSETIPFKKLLLKVKK